MKYLWDDIAREMREAVNRAHAAYNQASEASKAILRDVPSGLPHPDGMQHGMQRITDAANEERHALDAYVKALRAFNDYVNQKSTQAGEVPDNRTSAGHTTASVLRRI